MRRSLKTVFSMVILVTMLFLISSLVFGASVTPQDVPASHWAYQSVKLLLDKGYLQLYQDQTFKGEQPVDRFTLATVVAKILGEVAAGNTGTNKDDVKILRSLTNEFRDDLVKVLTENSSLSKKLEDLTRQDQIIKEDLTRNIAAVQNLNEEQLELQKEVQQIIADIIILKKKVEKLESDVTQLKAEVNQLKEENKKNKLYILIAIILGAAGVAN